MYEVIATNHLKTVTFNRLYLELAYAKMTFDTARNCDDCASVDLMDALTGEILESWDYRNGRWVSPSFEN